LVQSLSSGSEESVILLVCLLWLVCEIVGGKILPRLRGEGSVKARGDSGSRLIIMFSILLSIAIASYFGKNGVTPLPDVFFYAGIVDACWNYVSSVFHMGSGTVLLDNGSNPKRSPNGHERPLSFHSSSIVHWALLTFVGFRSCIENIGRHNSHRGPFRVGLQLPNRRRRKGVENRVWTSVC